jgi:hypothetical protein
MCTLGLTSLPHIIDTDDKEGQQYTFSFDRYTPIYFINKIDLAINNCMLWRLAGIEMNGRDNNRNIYKWLKRQRLRWKFYVLYRV